MLQLITQGTVKMAFTCVCSHDKPHITPHPSSYSESWKFAVMHVCLEGYETTFIMHTRLMLTWGIDSERSVDDNWIPHFMIKCRG